VCICESICVDLWNVGVFWQAEISKRGIEIFVFFCIFVLQFTNRGALNERAEIKPIEPDPGSAGEGKGFKQMAAFYSYLPLIV